MQKGIIKLKNPPSLLACAAIGGKKEREGPLGGLFDYTDESDRFGMDTWEKSESEMQRLALEKALEKGGFTEHDIDAMFAGDLMNQCTGSAYGLLDFDIPFFGLYGACSTSAEGLALAALTLDGGAFERAAVITSSHFCSAERQFRYPVEYGGQRTPTSQWTVTGAGAFILGRGGGTKITEMLPGRTFDCGITDANNMGAAMACSAVDTITRYFRESGRQPDEFDLIATGDLGFEGREIACELLRKNDISTGENFRDCGLMIYDRKAQDMHAGGSGCGCSASVLACHISRELEAGRLRSVLYIATGALMSPSSVQQGQSIPGVAHLIRLEAEDK